MNKLIVLGIVGFAAQLIDGALGMGYGATSSSLLLVAGLTPAAASASVHFAELGTNVVSGASHWKLGNVDWGLVWRLGVPGAVGAFLGATLLSHLSTEAAAPVMAAILLGLGVYILTRFAIRPPKAVHTERSPHGARFLAPLGVVGGFVDATGGGGWGPVSTTALLSAGRTKPQKVVGSVDTSEFLVTASASIAFLIGLGSAGINWAFAAVLLAGGLVAAPFAAWLVSRLPAAVLGSAVGGLIIVTNLRTLAAQYDLVADHSVLLYVVVVVAWAGFVGLAVTRHRRAIRTAGSGDAPQETVGATA